MLCSSVARLRNEIPRKEWNRRSEGRSGDGGGVFMGPTGGVREEARGSHESHRRSEERSQGTLCVPLEEWGKEPGDLMCPTGGAREGAGEGGGAGGSCVPLSVQELA